MARVVAVADRLMMMSGLFEKYRATGGSFDGAEARFMASQLRACAEQLRADEAQNELLQENMLTEARGDKRAPESRPRLTRGILDVIDGGRA